MGNSISINPNPTHSDVILHWTSAKREKAVINIYNLFGQKISTLEMDLNPGLNERKINTDHFIPGVYFIEMVKNNQRETLKLVKN